MSDYRDIIESILNEDDTYNSLLKKQASVGKLFPKFFDRVKAVAQNGGVKLVEMFPEIWHFKVDSGDEQRHSAGVKYDVYFNFKNIGEILQKWVPNRKIWLPNESHVDYRKLAAEVLNDVSVEEDCSCPSDSFWGSEYIKTKRGSQYGRKETRPPKIRNPHQYGSLCKHAQLVMDVFPFYVSTFASFLKKYWHEEIVDLEDAFRKELSGVKQATAALAAKSPGNVQPGALKSIQKQAQTAQGEEIAPESEETNNGETNAQPSPSNAKKPEVKVDVKKNEPIKPNKANKPATKPVSGGKKQPPKPPSDDSKDNQKYKGKYQNP